MTPLLSLLSAISPEPTQNGEWGYRDISEIEEAGARVHLRLAQTIDMPANNHVLLLRKG